MRSIVEGMAIGAALRREHRRGRRCDGARGPGLVGRQDRRRALARPEARARSRDVPGHAAAGAAARRAAGRHGAGGIAAHAGAAAQARTGHAILLVEHDMDAVFAVADRITVMVNGSVHRLRARPKRCATTPTCRPPTSGTTHETRHTDHGQPARGQRPARLVRQQPRPARHRLPARRGETVGLLGRNGMGKSTLIRTLLGHVRQREGRIACRAATSEGAARTKSPSWASPTCPKAAASSPTSRCARTW